MAERTPHRAGGTRSAHRRTRCMALRACLHGLRWRRHTRLENSLAQMNRRLEMRTQIVGPLRIGCLAPGCRCHHVFMCHFIERQVGRAGARHTTEGFIYSTTPRAMIAVASLIFGAHRQPLSMLSRRRSTTGTCPYDMCGYLRGSGGGRGGREMPRQRETTRAYAILLFRTPSPKISF